MAKTKQIGVRFNREILDHLQINVGTDTAQRALNFLEKFYIHNYNSKTVLDCLQKNPQLVEKHTYIDNTFMGEQIPEGLTGIPLAVWKNNLKIKLKSK